MTTVGFTGRRTDLTPTQYGELVETVRAWRNVTTVRHGACVGADETFHRIVRDIWPDVRIHVHPPADLGRAALWTMEDADVLHLQAPYLERNADIVDGSDVLVATPDGPERARSGTWWTVRYAKRSRCPIGAVILP